MISVICAFVAGYILAYFIKTYRQRPVLDPTRRKKSPYSIGIIGHNGSTRYVVLKNNKIRRNADDTYTHWGDYKDALERMNFYEDTEGYEITVLQNKYNI